MNFLLNADIVNLLLKTNGGRDRRTNFVFCSLKCFNCLLVGGGGLRLILYVEYTLKVNLMTSNKVIKAEQKKTQN